MAIAHHLLRRWAYEGVEFAEPFGIGPAKADLGA
jgi:hypothetical protein